MSGSGGSGEGSASESAGEQSRLLSASALMAAGTVVSRLTGFVRSALLLAVLGKSLDADVFATANTLPNSLYILVAGGVFNVVLVPQLVRAMRSDADGGEAFAQRLLSLGVLVLIGATAVLMALVPVLAHVVFSSDLFTPELEPTAAVGVRADVVVHAAGLLLRRVRAGRPDAQRTRAVRPDDVGADRQQRGRVRGARRSTPSSGARPTAATASPPRRWSCSAPARRSASRCRRWCSCRTPGRPASGSGCAPTCAASGSGTTLRLGAWTVAFVVANQVAFVIVTRLATGSSTQAALDGSELPTASRSTRARSWSPQVPHAIITVSLVTATMPLLSRLAADGELARMRDEIATTLRLVLAAIAPVAVALACLGRPLAAVLFSSARSTAPRRRWAARWRRSRPGCCCSPSTT